MLTRDALAAQLQELGLRAGDCVMMHSSLSALGPVDGGPVAVVDALRCAIGREGTLLAPAFRDSVWGEPEDFANSDCDCTRADGLCASRLSGFQGIIAEEVRLRPGALRSCHPTHSWVAWGPAARDLLTGHRGSATPCGAGNPFEELVRRNGQILLLGVGVNSITMWHYGEERIGVPYVGHYWPRERHLNHCVPGRRIYYEYPGIMQDVCRAAGILKTARVGKSISGLISAGEFVKFQATILAADAWCLVVRPPDRNCGDLAVDALRKSAGMLAAWTRGAQPFPSAASETPAAVEPADRGAVREDCPAFTGYHMNAGEEVPLCRANDRHPDYFRAGGAFASHGVATCDRCEWSRRWKPAGKETPESL